MTEKTITAITPLYRQWIVTFWCGYTKAGGDDGEVIPTECPLHGDECGPEDADND